MKDTELYRQLLGVESPWRVESVEMDVGSRQVVVHLECGRATRWADPELGALHVHGWEERSWRHLDSCGFATELRAKVPRVKRPDGGTETVSVPWAEKFSRFSKGFEAFAVRVLQAAGNVSDAARLLDVSWDQAHRIMGRAVRRGLFRRSLDGVRYAGIDEKSFGGGQDYVTVVCDIEGGRVVEVTPGHDAAAGIKALGVFTEEQGKEIEAVAMDLGRAYEKAAGEALPLAEIVHDRFHVSALLGKAVDAVRREEHRRLMARGDDTLKHTKFHFMGAPDNLNPIQSESLATLLSMDLKVGRAWTLKEMLRHFWTRPSMSAALDLFEKWYSRAVRSRLKPMVTAAKSLKERIFGLLAYHAHPISNAVAEGLNSRIQSIKSNARGFRSFDNYRNRILFFLGGLDLQPV